MTIEPKTIREVNIEMSRLGEQISFHSKAFYGVAGIAAIVAGVLFTKIDTVETDTATLIKGQEAIEFRLSKIESLLEKIEGNTEQAATDMSEIKTALSSDTSGQNPSMVSAWKSFRENNPEAVNALIGEGGESNVWIFQNKGSLPE